MSTSHENPFAGTSIERAALRKFGTVPEGFEIYEAGWVEEKPADFKTMRVRGAVFRRGRRVPNTFMVTNVTREEMQQAADEVQANIKPTAATPAPASFDPLPDAVGARP